MVTILQSLSKTIHLSLVLAILLFLGLFFGGGDFAFDQLFWSWLFRYFHVLAGVMWIKSQPECGKLEFENPNYYSHPNIAGYSDDLIENTDIFPAYDFAPHDGEILLFPSYLRHGVHVNNSKEDRISVAFNCVLVKA